MSDFPFPLAQYSASSLPPLNYVGSAARPPQPSARSTGCHLRRNAALPNILKSVFTIPLEHFTTKVQTFVSTIASVDMAGDQHSLPHPSDQSRLVLQIRPPERSHPTRNVPVAKSLLQVSKPTDVNDAIGLSILPTASYLFRTISQNRDPAQHNSYSPSPENFRWKPIQPHFRDSRLYFDGEERTRPTPIFQGFTWTPKEAKHMVDVKGKGKEVESQPDDESSRQLFMATCPRWILTTQDFHDMVKPRKLSESTSPTNPFGETNSKIGDNMLAILTDHCYHHRIHHVVITSHDLWTFGTFSTDWSEVHLTPPIPYDSAPPEHAPLNSIHPKHLAHVTDARISILQALLLMMESATSKPRLPVENPAVVTLSEPRKTNMKTRSGLELSLGTSAGLAIAMSSRSEQQLPPPVHKPDGKRRRQSIGDSLRQRSLSPTGDAGNLSDRSFDTVTTFGGTEADKVESSNISKRRRVAAASHSRPARSPADSPPYLPPTPSRSPTPHATNEMLQKPVTTLGPSSSHIGNDIPNDPIPRSTPLLQPPLGNSIPAPPRQTIHHVATVKLFQGFGPVGRERSLKIAESLRLSRKNSKGKGKDVEIDRDIHGSSRAALAVARAR